MEATTAIPATITVMQAARIVGLARATAYDAIHRGDLPSIRIGQRLFVPTHELLRMLSIDPSSDAARQLFAAGS